MRARRADRCHLAMLEALYDGEDPTTWLEPVSGTNYQTANQA